MKGGGMRLLLLLLVAGSMRCWAQVGLTATIPAKAGATMALSAYTGLDVVVLDSLHGDASGRFVYEPMLSQGMYVVDDGQTTVEFLSVGQPVAFQLDDMDHPYAVQFTDSPENTRWMAYQRYRKQHRYGSKEPERFRYLCDSLVAGADDYASRLIRADSDPVLHDADFADSTLFSTNVLTTKIVSRLERSEGDFIVVVDQILGLAKTTLPGYAFALQYLLEGFTAMGIAQVTDHLLNFPQIAEGELTPEQGAWLEELVEPYQRVRVGTKAPDVEGVAIDGRHYHLYDSKARRTLIVFWSVDCEYCHDFLVKIRKNMDLNRDVELVTIALADHRQEVKDALRKLHLPGIHLYDEARWNGKAFLDYHVATTPSVFLLDEEKVIVCKPFVWDDLRDYLKNNQKKK